MIAKKILHSRKAFTLMELMIVIAIVWILMTVWLLPYKDYMDRAELINTIDNINQEWILSHKEVRNWIESTNKEWEDIEKKHLATILNFKKWEQKVIKYEVDWDIVSEKNDNTYQFNTEKIKENIKNFQNISKNTKNIYFGNNIIIKDSLYANEEKYDEIFYIIIPPFGKWKFYNQNWEEINTKQIETKIWFKNAEIPNNKNIINPRVRNVLFRPYLQ